MGTHLEEAIAALLGYSLLLSSNEVLWVLKGPLELLVTALIDRALHVLEGLSHCYRCLVPLTCAEEFAIVFRRGIIGLAESILLVDQHLCLLMLRSIPCRKTSKLLGCAELANNRAWAHYFLHFIMLSHRWFTFYERISMVLLMSLSWPDSLGDIFWLKRLSLALVAACIDHWLE